MPLDFCSQIWEHPDTTVFGERLLTKFAIKHADARMSIVRFLRLVRAAEWPHFGALKQTFPTADLGKRTRTVIFNLGGNKYRVVTLVNFEQRAVLIDQALTHGNTAGRIYKQHAHCHV